MGKLRSLGINNISEEVLNFNKPTRRNSRTSLGRCIDFFVSTDKIHFKQKALFDYDASDHLPIKCRYTMPSQSPEAPLESIDLTRLKNERTRAKILNDERWSSVLKGENKAELFVSAARAIIKEHMMRPASIHREMIPKNLRLAIEERRKFYRTTSFNSDHYAALKSKVEELKKS